MRPFRKFAPRPKPLLRLSRGPATYNRTVDYASRIVRDVHVRFGKPVVKGTRITVADVLGHLAAGDSVEDVVAELPSLTVEDVRACLAYAADRDRLLHIA